MQNKYPQKTTSKAGKKNIKLIEKRGRDYKKKK